MTGRDDVQRTDEPLERATRLANAGLAGVEADPEHGDDVRAIVMIYTEGRGGIAIHGYDDGSGTEPLADMLTHLQALFAAQGKQLTFMTDEQPAGRPELMTRRSEIDAQLQALYDQVPVIPDCDGSCWISCGPIEMADRERQRLRDAGYRITPAAQALMQAGTYWCEALKDRRCAVYELRPMVCRWWGTTEDMKCPRGCVPEGGFLTDEQGWHLLAEADRVGGHGVPKERDVASLPPSARAHMQRVMEAGRGGVGLRARHQLPAGFRPELAEAPCPSCGFLLAIPDGPPAGGVCGNCGTRLKGEWAG